MQGSQTGELFCLHLRLGAGDDPLAGLSSATVLRARDRWTECALHLTRPSGDRPPRRV